MIKFTQTIVKRPVAALIIISAVVVFGLMSILTMPQELMPEMDFPMLGIFTVYPGAGPDDVERLVTSEKVNAVAAESGVRNIISDSSENVSVVILQYEYGQDMDSAYTNLSRAMGSIANVLPDDALTPVIIFADMGGTSTMTLSVHSATMDNLLHYVEDEVVPQLTRLSTVATVNVSGGQEDYIRVEVLEELLSQHNLSIHSIIQAMSGIGHTAPLGTATFGDLDLATRIQVRHDSLDDLRRIPIILPTGGVIRVDDVANVQISAMDASSISRYNGDDTITITIQNPQAVSANATSDDVIRTINAIMADNPEISIAVIHDNSEMIADSLFSVAQTLVLAIVLAMVILYLFLGDLRASLIVGSSMPISLLVTFIFMDFMGYTLNIVTMSGLIIGVGMMVDNAIVVIDSCFRARKEGRTFKEAAVEGTRFVMLSIIAVTLTTVVVFVPLATVQGLAGQMFAPIGFSIVFALVASLLSAVSLVPLFFFQFKPIERSNAPVTKLFNKLENGYANLLTKILNKKKTVLAITGGIMALAVFLATFLNFELMPPIDEGIININITTRPGLNLERTDEILVELEGIVSQHPDVSHFILTSGAGGTATLTAHLLSNRNMQTSQVIDQWWQETRHVLDVDINISSSDFMGMGAMGDSGIPIVLEGETLDVLRDAAAMVEDMMLQHPDIIRVNSTFDRANPQAEIVVDPLMAAFHGITPQMVTGSVFIALNGSEVAEITMDSQRFAVRVEYPRGRYETVNDVANMMVMSGSGALVPLSQISTVEFTDTPQTISRQNNMYTATITAVPLDAARFTAQAEIQSAVAGMTFPEGIQQGRSLDDQMMDEELAALGVAIITAILLVFMVMAIQFESIRHSLMVMVCVPLAVIGSLLLMVATGVTISMVSLLGFLVLIGLVVNNGILFVDTTNKYRQQKPLQDALIHAGRTRLRPIMMITLTSVLAMLPLALGFGDDTMQGLGVTVIGGLTASTALALLFLPTFYLIIDGNSEKREERRRLRTEKREQKIEGHI